MTDCVNDEKSTIRYGRNATSKKKKKKISFPKCHNQKLLMVVSEQVHSSFFFFFSFFLLNQNKISDCLVKSRMGTDGGYLC